MNDAARHDADLAFAGGQDAGAVRTDQARLRAREGALHADHVENRNAFGDRDDQFHLGVDRFENGVGAACGRNVDARGRCAGSRLGFGNGVVLGQVEVAGAALAGGNAGDHLGAVGQRGFSVEAAGLAGHTLGNDLGILVDENGHRVILIPVPGVGRFRLGMRHGVNSAKCNRPSGKINGPDRPMPCLPPRNLSSGAGRAGFSDQARVPSMPLQATSSSLTASTETWRFALASASSSTSTICSMPSAPIRAGTPT